MVLKERGGVIVGGEIDVHLPLIGGGYTDTVRGWTPPQFGSPAISGDDDVI